MVLTGQNLIVFWGWNTTWKSGTPNSDAQIPFNPTIAVPVPKVKTIIENATTASKLYPNIQWTSKKEGEEVTITSFYRDPFVWCQFFPDTTVTASWTGTADEIIGTFGDRSEEAYMWMVLQIADKAVNGHQNQNLFFDGGEITNYKIIFEAGQAVKEEFTIMFAEVTEVEYPIDIGAGFDDGCFDKTGVAEISTAIALAKASYAANEYFTFYVIDSAQIRTGYNAWINFTGSDANVPVTGFTAVECDISATSDANSVGVVIAAAIDALTGVGAANSTGTVTITNGVAGSVVDAVDVDTTMTIAVTVQGVTAQDGGWSNWDGNFAVTQVLHTSDLTITWGGVAISDIGIVSGTMEFGKKVIHDFLANSLTAGIRFEEINETPYKLTVKGFMTDNDNLSEALAEIANKTTGTAKILYNSNCFWQFTLGVVKEYTIGDVQTAGVELDIVIEGSASSAPSAQWKNDEATDPSALINHVSP